MISAPPWIAEPSVYDNTASAERRYDACKRSDPAIITVIGGWTVVGGNHDAVDAIGLSEEAATRPGLRRWRAGLHRDPWFV
jgi:hypothetical protein